MWDNIVIGVIVYVCSRHSGVLWVWGCGFPVFEGGGLIPMGVCSLGGFEFAPRRFCSLGNFLWVCVCVGGLFAPFGTCGGGGGGVPVSGLAIAGNFFLFIEILGRF